MVSLCLAFLPLRLPRCHTLLRVVAETESTSYLVVVLLPPTSLPERHLACTDKHTTCSMQNLQVDDPHLAAFTIRPQVHAHGSNTFTAACVRQVCTYVNNKGRKRDDYYRAWCCTRNSLPQWFTACHIHLHVPVPGLVQGVGPGHIERQSSTLLKYTTTRTLQLPPTPFGASFP